MSVISWLVKRSESYMDRSNCLIFAIWRTVRRGGVLILQRSHAGPYLHAMWAKNLPADLDVEHFVPKRKARWVRLIPLFSGSVKNTVGTHHESPPVEKYGVSLVFLAFWIVIIFGVSSIGYLVSVLFF